MAELEKLSFDLIIDDSDFNRKISDVKQAAKELNAEVSQLLDLKNNMVKATEADVTSNKNAQKIIRENAKTRELEAKAMDRVAEARRKLRETNDSKISAENAVNREREAQAIIKTQTAQAKLNQLQDKGHDTVLSTSKLWQQMAGFLATFFSFQGGVNLVKNLVEVSAEFEKQRISLQAILRDVNGAEKIFEQIKALAIESPFNFKELVTYTKQLSAYSIPMGELYDTTKMLADVSAGLGVGMDRLVLAYGQIRSASFLRGQEVRQLTEAGIPILQELAKQIGELEGRAISVGEVFDRISTRQVTFQMVEKVFKDMTSEGGKFYKMQEVLAETLSGKLSNLKDAYQLMFAEIGEKNSGFLNSAVDATRNLITNYEEVGATIKTLIVTYGALRTAMLMIQLVTGELTVAQTLLGKSFISVGKYISANPYVALSLGMAAVVTEIVRMNKALTTGEKVQKAYNDTMAEGEKERNKEIAQLDTLYAVYHQAAEGSEEYDDAKKSIMSKYSTYISELAAEGKAVEDLGNIYEDLKDKITNAMESRYLDKAQTSVDETFGDVVGKITDDFQREMKRKVLQKYNMNAEDRQALWRFVIGDIDKEGLKEYKTALAVYEDYANGVSSFVNSWRKDYEEASNVYKKSIEDIKNARKSLVAGDEEKEVEVSLTEFVKRVQSAFNELNVANGKDRYKALWADQYTDQFSYIDDLRKRRKEILEQQAQLASYETDSKKALEEELKLINLIFEKTEKSPIAPSSSENTEKTPAWLKNEINMMKSLLEWYNKLKNAGMNEDAVKGTLSRIFPDYKEIININGYKQRLNELADAIEKFGGTAAEDLRRSLGITELDKVLDLQQAKQKAERMAETYKSFMASFLGAGEISGSGVTFNISKILADYENAIDKINDKKIQAQKKVRETYESSLGNPETALSKEWIDSQLNIITNEVERQMSNELAKANEAIRKQGDEWVKNWDRLESFDLSHMADLTVKELRDIESAIKEWSPDMIDSKLIEELTQAGADVDEFVNAVIESLDKLGEQVDNKQRDKAFNRAKKWMNLLKEMTQTVQDYAEELGNVGLSREMQTLSKSADMAINVLDRAKDGDTFGAIMAGITGAADAALDAATSAAKFKMALEEAKNELKQIDYQNSLSNGVDTIFGTNTRKEIANAINNIEELREKMKATGEEIMDVKARTGSISWSNLITAPTATFTWIKSLTIKSRTLSEILDDMGAQLYDENGAFNVDALQKVIDTYDGLSKKEKKALEEAITDANAYNDALKQLEDTISSLWGDMADNMADKMISAYDEMGDAAYDLADNMDGIFADLSRSIAKSLISSFIIDNILSKYKADVEALYADMATEGSDPDIIAQKFAAIAENVSKDADLATDFTNRLLTAFENAGVTSNGSSDSLSGGIASITEQTADLMASYLNAIRADVSLNRAYLGNINTNIEAILNLLPSAPTLADYLMQIQANTFNTAEYSRQILGELQSVVGDGATSFVRIQ